MRALSIRQPYVEEILLGHKTVEYRSIRTNIIGERFYIYAPAQSADRESIEEYCHLDWPRDALKALPRRLLVGTAIIDECRGEPGDWEWVLRDVRRLKRPRKVTGRPGPIWFNPF